MRNTTHDINIDETLSFPDMSFFEELSKKSIQKYERLLRNDETFRLAMETISTLWAQARPDPHFIHDAKREYQKYCKICNREDAANVYISIETLLTRNLLIQLAILDRSSNRQNTQTELLNTKILYLEKTQELIEFFETLLERISITYELVNINQKRVYQEKKKQILWIKDVSLIQSPQSKKNIRSVSSENKVRVSEIIENYSNTSSIKFFQSLWKELYKDIFLELQKKPYLIENTQYLQRFLSETFNEVLKKFSLPKWCYIWFLDIWNISGENTCFQLEFEIVIPKAISQWVLDTYQHGNISTSPGTQKVRLDIDIQSGENPFLIFTKLVEFSHISQWLSNTQSKYQHIVNTPELLVILEHIWETSFDINDIETLEYNWHSIEKIYNQRDELCDIISTIWLNNLRETFWSNFLGDYDDIISLLNFEYHKYLSIPEKYIQANWMVSELQPWDREFSHKTIWLFQATGKKYISWSVSYGKVILFDGYDTQRNSLVLPRYFILTNSDTFKELNENKIVLWEIDFWETWDLDIATALSSISINTKGMWEDLNYYLQVEDGVNSQMLPWWEWVTLQLENFEHLYITVTLKWGKISIEIITNSWKQYFDSNLFREINILIQQLFDK